MRPILDACCGSRMFWFDKENPNVVFADIRYEDLDLNHGNRACHIRPDKMHDFRKMDFADNTFHLVVFDPPHLKGAGKTGYMAKKYGTLDNNWPSDLKAGFDECMRVLKPNGTLIFKWNESSIKVSEIIKVFGRDPLFGHKTLQTSKTIWLAFMKLEEIKPCEHEPIDVHSLSNMLRYSSQAAEYKVPCRKCSKTLNAKWEVVE